MTRYTASTITDDALDDLHARLERFSRALDRAWALAEGWQGDQSPMARAEAAELLAEAIETRGWVRSDPTPPLRVVPQQSA